jgi:hypothetical protein
VPRSLGTILVVLRIAIVWLSIYGAGSQLLSISRRRMPGLQLPDEKLLYGFCVFLVVLPLLSLLGILNRAVVSALVCTFAVVGTLCLFASSRSARWRLPRIAVWMIPVATLAIFLCVGNLARAARPNDNPDALITYAVQPDRWLDAGRIYFLDETEFSAMPLVGEVISLPAASLSSGRLDQLSLLQVFQMTLLLAALLYAPAKLGGGRRAMLIALCTGAACPMLAGWGGLAKTEMTATFLVTIALSTAARSADMKQSVPLTAWLAFGLAAATKLTIWPLLPVFLLFASFARPERKRLQKAVAGFAVLALAPLAFALRTWIHTGSPLYPASFPFLTPNREWVIAAAPMIDSLFARARASIGVELLDLWRSWDVVLYLLLLGLASLAISGSLRKAVLPLAGVLLFSAMCIVFFWPLAWGVKYSLPVLPLIAGCGGLWLTRSRLPTPGVLITAVLVAAASPIVPRAQFIWSFLRSESPLQFDTDLYRSPRPIHLWANDNLPAGSRLLSLFSAERYFSDFKVICARTHPMARGIFAADGLDRELDILLELGVTHVYFDMADPMESNFLSLYYWSVPLPPPDLAGELSILTAVDSAGPLVPVACVEGFQVCEVHYPE